MTSPRLELGQVLLGLQVELLQPGELGDQGDDAVAAVIAGADGDALGVEEDEEGVERREAGAVGEAKERR